QNNLVLEQMRDIDFVFIDHARGKFSGLCLGDVPSLLKSKEWRFSHNWREIAEPKADSPNRPFWIPAGHQDRLKVKVKLQPGKLGDPNSLRPGANPSLGTGGVKDVALPPYVGAVPPEGIEPWNWQWTWDAHFRRLLTVSQKPEGGGRFRTVKEAL